MPCRGRGSGAADPDPEPCWFLLPNYCWKSRTTHLVLPGWLKHSGTFSKSSPPERAASDSSSQAGQMLLLLLLGCSYIPSLLAQGTQNSCHVCSQHTGLGSCSLQLLLLQQNHIFYGANFREDQMNPVFSSTSTDQPTALIPFYFCQKMGRTKDESLKTREG